MQYPGAISFASGRPAEQFFQLEKWLGAVGRFIDYMAKRDGLAPEQAGNLLAQYGRTNGCINELIAEQVRRDEKLDAAPERVIVTAGCQEAISLAVGALCSEPDDILLAGTPTYIGITGVADLADIELQAVPGVGDPDFPAQLDIAIADAQARGKSPKAIYLIPEFDNPTGTSLPVDARRQVLDSCRRHGIVILEDNPYGLFRFDGEPVPAFRTLDEHGGVIYLGTYSKSLCPSVRTGFMLFPESLFSSVDDVNALMDDVSVRKSFLTVNSSQILQAIVGGVLLAQDGSLAALVTPAQQFYRTNRDVMVAALDRYLSPLSPDITWNVPAGGFFLTVELPFEFLADHAERCAMDHGVIVMPLSFFALDDGCRRRIRLAFSNRQPDEIEEGVRRLAVCVAGLLERKQAV